MLAVLHLPAVASSQCFTQAYGALVGSGDDGPVRAPLPLGFAFPLAGTTWTDVAIGDNGVLFLANGSLPAPATPTGYSTVPSILVGSLLNGGPKIAAYWNDLVTQTANDGGIYFDNSQPGRCVVTWHNTVEYLHTLRKTIQVQLEANGTIQFFYSAGFTVDRGLGLCGFSQGGGILDPGPIDLTAAGAAAGSTLYELFSPSALLFDLGAATVRFTPGVGGYAISVAACDPAWQEDHGVGCGGDRRAFYEAFDGGHPIDLGGKTVRALENATGGYDVSVGPLTTFVPPIATGLAFGDDEVQPRLLGFSWDFPGGATSVIQIDSNGRIALWWNANFQPVSDYLPSVEKLLAFPQGILCVPHGDFVPDGATNIDNVFLETDNATEARITWRNVRCFGSNNRSTFQVVLFHTPGPGGDGFELRYQTIVNDSTFDPAAVVGFAFGPGARDPGPRDLSATLPFTTAADAFNDIRLSASPAPVLGNTVVFTTSNLRSGLAANVIGFTGVPGGLELLPLAPRCYAYLILDGSELVTVLGAGSIATNSAAIPALPVFVGIDYVSQSLQLAPGINALGLVTSNAVFGRVQAY